ncbi:hypothetical protein PENSPDRAFT_695658 [Peniophora sp. CONT]|nr:hypothetical protein PENSPDRAFT_695658 [Peniophora sp. CONT]
MSFSFPIDQSAAVGASFPSTPDISATSALSTWSSAVPSPPPATECSSEVPTAGDSAPSSPPGLARQAVLHASPAFGPLVSLHVYWFMEFLAAHLDYRGLRQSILWHLHPVGRAIIQLGTVIMHRQCLGVECFARVTHFVVRSSEEVLFQVNILGWQTSMGWREPAGYLHSFVIVPLKRCGPDFLTWAWAPFTYPFSLQQQAQYSFQLVRAYLAGDRSVRIPMHDWFIGWILHTYVMTPTSQLLGTHLATGFTVATDDLGPPSWVYGRTGQASWQWM